MPPSNISSLRERIAAGDRRALAGAITLVENNLAGAEELLLSLRHTAAPRVVGITGPPGAGKSTLVNALLSEWTDAGKTIAVIAIDPSSPFHFGSLLGDRIRMARFYNHPLVFIRSLASRGALGGLHPRIYEITDVVKEGGFDLIIIETVGVGQSEVDIAGLADCTVVTLVPEAGDTIQTMKAGLLEIADLFVVNKSDRADAEAMYRALRIMAHEQAIDGVEIPVLRTVASDGSGIPELADTMLDLLATKKGPSARQRFLRGQKLYRLIQSERMADVTQQAITALIEDERIAGDNIYQLAKTIAGRGIEAVL